MLLRGDRNENVGVDGATSSTGIAVVTARIDGSRFPPTPLSGPATVYAPAVRLAAGAG